MIGNSYGKSTTFPVRRDMPNSQQVMSDPEFTADWQARLAQIPQFIGVPGASDGAQSITTDWGSNQNVPFKAPGGPGVQGMTAGQNYGAGAPGGAGIQSITMGSDQGFIPRAVGGEGVLSVTQTAPGEPVREINPEWQRMQNEMLAAMQQRQESQVAQQQAYNGMLGQGQKNGVMGENYTTPGFGRVDGQAQNPYMINPGGDNDMSWARGYDNQQQLTGVYDPLKQTQETFWGL